MSMSQQGYGDDPSTGTSLRSLSDTVFGGPFSQLASKYDVKKKIELYKGSVSTVYKCLLAGGKPVVIKTYHKSKMAEKHFHKLEREISAMRALCREVGKKGVVHLLDAYEDSLGIHLVMECCEGGDLFKRLMIHGGKLPEQWVSVQVVGPLLRVLDRMHALHLMHRDIKPENIFISSDGQVKLGDFGLAIDWTRELPFSRSGTLDYMAPEVLLNPATHTQESPAVTILQLQNKHIRPYTCAVDVWAVGCLAYELVCGRPPFEVEDEKQTASLIIYSNKIHYDSSATAAWADFVTQALVKDPRVRPTAAALLGHSWIRGNMERVAAAAQTATAGKHTAMTAAVAAAACRSSSTTETVETVDTVEAVTASGLDSATHPTSDRSGGLLRVPAPAAGAVSGSSSTVSVCRTLSTVGDSSVSSTDYLGGLSSRSRSTATGCASHTGASGTSATHQQQQQQRQTLLNRTAIGTGTATATCAPSPSSTIGSRGAGTMRATTRTSLQSTSTAPPPTSPPSVNANGSGNSCTTSPATSSGAMYGSFLSASTPPQTRSAPAKQTTAPSFRGTGSAAAGGGGGSGGGSSMGALRSLLDAFKSASVCNTPAAVKIASNAERAEPPSSAAAAAMVVDATAATTAVVRTSASGKLNRCSSGGGSVVNSDHINANVLSNDGSAATGVSMRSSLQFPLSHDRTGNCNSGGGGGGAPNSARVLSSSSSSSFQVQLPNSSRERDRNSSVSGSRTPSVIQSNVPPMTPYGQLSSSLRVPSPRVAVRGQVLFAQRSTRGSSGGGGGGGGGNSPIDSYPGGSGSGGGGGGSPLWLSSSSGVARTGCSLVNQSGSCAAGLSPLPRSAESLSSLDVYGKVSSLPSPRASVDVLTAAAAASVLTSPKGDSGRPPRPTQPETPRKGVGAPSESVDMVVSRAATTASSRPPIKYTPSSTGIDDFNTPSPPPLPARQSHQPQQERPAAHIAVQQTFCDWQQQHQELQQYGSGSGASHSTLHELTRNWGAVVSVSVGKMSSVVGSGSEYSSPQRLPATGCDGGSAKGLDPYGLPPPTPVASGLLTSDYCSPRPSGVLERVKSHLRGESCVRTAALNRMTANMTSPQQQQQQQQQQQTVRQSLGMYDIQVESTEPMATVDVI